MTAAYTCPRCVNLIVYGIPHDCVPIGVKPGDPATWPIAYNNFPGGPDALPEREAVHTPATGPTSRSESASKLGSDSPEAVRPGREGAPPDPTSPPPYPLSDPNQDLAPGGSCDGPADVPPDRRTEGAVTPEAGAKHPRPCVECDGWLIHAVWCPIQDEDAA